MELSLQIEQRVLFNAQKFADTITYNTKKEQKCKPLGLSQSESLVYVHAIR